MSFGSSSLEGSFGVFMTLVITLLGARAVQTSHVSKGAVFHVQDGGTNAFRQSGKPVNPGADAHFSFTKIGSIKLPNLYHAVSLKAGAHRMRAADQIYHNVIIDGAVIGTEYSGDSQLIGFNCAAHGVHSNSGFGRGPSGIVLLTVGDR